MNATNLPYQYIDKRARSNRRSRKGSSIAEFAPALYLLFIVGFFPMLDIIGILLSYSDCQYLHFTLVRQAALENILVAAPGSNPPWTVDTTFATQPGGAFQNLITSWYNGIGHYTTKSLSDINVTVSVDLTKGTNKLKYVLVQTTVVCNPLVPIPLPYAVPGFNAPATYSLFGTSVIENVPS